MREHDIERNNVISFTEFKALLLDFDDIRDAERYQFDSQVLKDGKGNGYKGKEETKY